MSMNVLRTSNAIIIFHKKKLASLIRYYLSLDTSFCIKFAIIYLCNLPSILKPFHSYASPPPRYSYPHPFECFKCLCSSQVSRYIPFCHPISFSHFFPTSFPLPRFVENIGVEPMTSRMQI